MLTLSKHWVIHNIRERDENGITNFYIDQPLEKNSESSEAVSPSKPLTATELKVKGNEAFKLGKYKDAVDYYSKAIETVKKTKSRINKKEDLATYHQNRAAAYEKLVSSTIVNP